MGKLVQYVGTSYGSDISNELQNQNPCMTLRSSQDTQHGRRWSDPANSTFRPHVKSSELLT